MGVSTDGLLWYGVVFDDDYEFPWTKTVQELEEWWRDEQGFDPEKDYPADGWLEHRKEFDATHPCPVESVYHCSDEYTMYGLAVRGASHTAYRGSPKLIETFTVPHGDVQELKQFLEKYQLKPQGEIGWWLASYWG